MSRTVEQKITGKIRFKDSWSEVTLEEFINIGRIQGNEEFTDLRLQQRIRMIEVLTDLTYDELCNVPSNNLGPIIEATSFIDRDPPKVSKQKPFKIGEVEYIFHPDFRNLSTGEMISVEQLIMDGNNKGENVTPGLLAILIRPSKVVPDDKLGTKTVIEDFDSSTWAERKEMFLKHLTVDKFFHELAFFLKKGESSAISSLLSSQSQKKSQTKKETKK